MQSSLFERSAGGLFEFDLTCFADLMEAAVEAERLQEVIDTNRAALQQQFEDEVFDLATSEFELRFEESYASWLRPLKPNYHRDLGRLKRLLKDKMPLGY